MAWLIDKNWHIHGPNFEIISNPGNTKLINDSGICSFLPWYPSDEPVVARQVESYRGKLDDMTIVAGTVAVSKKFRDLVEEFEPGIHAFAPIILERKNGERFDEYFLFSTQQDIDCLITDNDPENFRYISGFEPDETRILCRLTEPGWEIPISSPAIEGKHLWTAGLLGRSAMFVSNTFRTALTKGFRGRIRLDRECISLSLPWVAEEQMGPLLERWKDYVAHNRQRVDLSIGEWRS